MEIRETVQEIFVPTYKEVEEQVSAKPRLFDHVADEEILGYGVPAEWLADVREANEDTLLTLADHLPSEAAEALLELATGGKPQVAQPLAEAADPFEHPDAQRRFRVMNNVDELAAALDYPWDKWTIFLHPAQRELVERDFNGPARVAGSAGTGKTIVALHRAVHLARHNRESRILLTTFSDTLSNALRAKLRRLLHHEPRLGENIEVYSIDAIGRRLYELQFGVPNIASSDLIRSVALRKRPRKSADINSVNTFCGQSGPRWWTRGSWTHGKLIAISVAWEERRDYRNSSVLWCGRSLIACGRACRGMA